MKRACLYIFVYVTTILLSFSPPDTPLDRLIAGFKKYLDEAPQEKVYLHFDRAYYTSGETIWFKAYLTSGAFHIPSSLSRTIYVELINEEGRLVRQSKLLSLNGSAAGEIVLSDSLESGNYLVRAYTRWMKNTGEDYFFHRYLKIWNTVGQSASKSPLEKNLDVQFFPESGDLVNGVLSKVAVKAVAEDGLGKQIKGRVVDESGNLICEFKCNVLGMGAFDLTPQKGKSYIALIEGHGLEFKLPVAKESGLTMSIKNLPSSPDVILRIETVGAPVRRTVYILAQTRGIVCYAARMDLSATSVMAKIDKSKFPPGIAQITVVDQGGLPLAERLTFINEMEQFSIEVKTNKTTYAPRELVTVQIKATSPNGTPTLADLSLSVCDDSRVHFDDNRETIGTYLLLSSELRGLIESPGYYFNPENKDRAEALDYLLLTQGWRRFTFKRAMDPQWNPEYKIEKGLTIKGKMRDVNNKTPVSDGKVTYLSVNAVPFTSTVRTNNLGEFELSDIIYFDSTQAVLQGETKKGSKLIKLTLDNGTDFPSIHFPLLHFTHTETDFEQSFIDGSTERTNIDKAYNFDEKTIKLNEIVIRGKKDDLQNNVSKTYGKGTATVQVAGDPAMENQMHALQLLQTRVAGVIVSGAGTNWNVSIRGGGTPFIMIDDVPVSIDNLNSLSVHDIERVEVWKGGDAAIFGARGGNGVLGFYTKRGGGSRVEHGTVHFTNMGYHIEREFYAPTYDTQRPEHIKPDKRTTLFWAPRITTDSLGQASVSFYNHDLETTITGIVEGLSQTGKPGTSEFRFTIRKD
jgi:hypothetical protein